jgi:micrococcal nuclease
MEVNMKKIVLFIFCMLLNISLSGVTYALTTNAVVDSVIDGDTIKVKIGQDIKTVRLLLIDTPETKHPKLKVQPYGKEAYNYTNRLLKKGAGVKIEYDKLKSDKYNRLLAYVYLNDKMLNELLVREGLARVGYVIKPNIKHLEKLQKAEKKAKEEKLNIWLEDGYVTKDGFKSKQK